MSTTQATAPNRNKRLKRGPHGGIELLLIQSVDHLGKQGDVVEVKRGYAMNYLLPQGLATVATDHHKRMVEKHRARLQAIQNARMAGLRNLADEIGKKSITIEANANDEGHLYGSVGAVEIVKALKQHDVTITADQVRLKGPLKELGLYTVQIHMGHEIEADLKVWVVPTVTAPEAPAAEAKPAGS
jgi:large subunit ribosomal protein L9